MTFLDCGQSATITVTLDGTLDATIYGAVGDLPGGVGVWLTAPVTVPEFAYRYDYAPTSRWLPGQRLLGAVPDLSAVGLSLGVRAGSLDGIESAKAGLEAVLAQWGYTVTINVDDPDDGDSGGTPLGPWAALPTRPVWGPVVPGEYGGRYTQGALSIPVNPVGAS